MNLEEKASWYLPLGDLVSKNSSFECRFPLGWASKRTVHLPLGRLVSKKDPFECHLPLEWTSNRTLPGTYPGFLCLYQRARSSIEPPEWISNRRLPGTYLGFLYLSQETPWSVLYHVKGYPTKRLLVPLFSLKGLFLETQEGIRRGRSGNLFDAEGALSQKKSRRMVL